MHRGDYLAPGHLTPSGDISVSDYSGRTRTATNGTADGGRRSEVGGRARRQVGKPVRRPAAAAANIPGLPDPSEVREVREVRPGRDQTASRSLAERPSDLQPPTSDSSREGGAMTPGYRTETAPGSGRKTTRHLHRLAMAAVLAILVSPVAATVWTHPAGVARAQDEAAAGDVLLPGQVIAQGIARLPRGELAWTVRSIQAPGGKGTPVTSFPVGFAVADGATIAVLDEQRDVLNLLQDGEAAFLPVGKAGALASWEEDEASLYEVALVSGREASGGETPGTVAGNPFAAPRGTTFDIELARTVLARDDQTTIPVSRSGAPVLYLQTSGATQLQAGDSQPVELAAGQFATLMGDVTARGASDEPATFLVAVIG